MKVFSTNSLPARARVRQTFDMIVHTGTVSLASVAPGSTDDRSKEVRRKFVAMAPKEANAIIGVEVSTDVVLYDIGGGGSLYFTFSGNPAIIEEA